MKSKKIYDLPTRRKMISKICAEYNDKIALYWKEAYYIERAKTRIIEILLWDELKKIQWLSVGRMAASREIEKMKYVINSYKNLSLINCYCTDTINTLLRNQLEIEDFNSYSLVKSKSNSMQKKWEDISDVNQVWINDRIKDNLNKLKNELNIIFDGNQWKVWTKEQEETNLIKVKNAVIEKLVSTEKEKIKELDFCRMAVNKELDEIEYEILYNCKDISQIRNYCNSKIDQLVKYSMHPEPKSKEFDSIPPTLTGPQFAMNFPTEECTEINWEILEELKNFVNIPQKQQRLNINDKSFIWKSINIKVPNQENGENVAADWFILSEVDIEPWNEWKWKATEWQITRIEANNYRKYMPTPKNICDILRSIKYYIKNKHWIIIDDGIDYENDLRKWWAKSIAWEYLKKLLSLKGIYFINGENGEKRKTLVSYDNNLSFSTFTGRTATPIDEIKHLAIFFIPKKNEQ